MGCTSSTTNMPEPHASTTANVDNNVTPEDSEEHNKENNIIYSNNREFEKTQVLPECEIKNDQTKLAGDCNIISKADLSAVDNKDIQDTSLTELHDDTIQITESSPLEENFVSLKDVVEKVILENADEDEKTSILLQTQNMDLDRQIDEIFMETNISGDVEEIEYNEDDAKESSSPTQSEDSRATRWEALADIAAELPPSLAVDPLTGQIYSLTK